MMSLAQLEEKGAQVVAGLVLYKGARVEGVWTKEGFHPADGGPLDEAPAPAAKKKGKGE